jgi:transcriptional regulator with XRE-family HTH domain
MTRIKDLHSEWMKDPEYRQEYDALAAEFELVRALIEARSQAGLTQEQLAERMDTSQSAVARMESGKIMPSSRTLERFARATGTRLRISFEPEKPKLSGNLQARKP